MTDLESDRVERTVSTNNTDKFCQAICAFSNDMPNHRQPGYLLIGVEDNGRISGIDITDNILINLAKHRTNGNILPVPVMNVDKYSYAEGDIAVVEVLPHSTPPVKYKGRIFIRVGPMKATASQAEE